MTETITQKVLQAVRESKNSIAKLDTLKSLRLTDEQSLKIILSRLKKRQDIINLKRGTYCLNPPRDPFAAAQATYNGYIGLHAALYIHGFIDEIPFTIHIITRNTSAKKRMGEYEFVAVALKKRAVGYTRYKDYFVSTKAKTIFDCLYLLNDPVINEKIVRGAKRAGVEKQDVIGLKKYLKNFAPKKEAKGFLKKLEENLNGS